MWSTKDAHGRRITASSWFYPDALLILLESNLQYFYVECWRERERCGIEFWKIFKILRIGILKFKDPDFQRYSDYLTYISICFILRFIFTVLRFKRKYDGRDSGIFEKFEAQCFTTDIPRRIGMAWRSCGSYQSQRSVHATFPQSLS